MNITDSEKKRCVFASKGVGNSFSGCKILYVDSCDGLDESCAFRKTKSQLTEENDRSIDRHRMLGMCAECKYHISPCRKSYEVGDDDR